MLELAIAFVIFVLIYPRFMIWRLYRQDEHCTNSVALGLSMHSRIDPRILPRIIRVLDDDDAPDAVKGHAASAIRYMGKRGAKARPQLIRLVRARGRWSCSSAVGALGKIGPVDAETKEVLMECLLAEDPVIQDTAMHTLNEVAPSGVLHGFSNAIDIEARRRVQSELDARSRDLRKGRH